MARNVVTPRAGEIELPERRTRHSKVFQKPDGGFRVTSRVRPQHWDDNGTWVEVDETPKSVDGRNWTTSSTPYVLNWDSETLTLSYQSRKGGDVVVRLTELDGAPLSGKPSAAVKEGQDIVCTVAPQLEIRLRVRSHGVEIYKILRGPAAPRRLTWEVIEGDLTNIRFDPMNTSGVDNLDKSQARKQTGAFNRQRTIEISHNKTPDNFVSNPGKKTYSVTEEFTGRTRFVDPTTRARSWVAEVEYPVEIDVTVNESTVAAADDGRGHATYDYWRQNFVHTIGYGTTYCCGIRFQTVDVPQGATINSATLTLNITNRSGTQNSTFSGQAVDDAPAWANLSANSPFTMAKTTANTVWATPATTGIKNIDVTSIIQEIINRPGWTNNADIRIGTTDISAMTASYFIAEGYEAAGTAEPDLTIDYTAGGVAGERVKTILLLGVG